MIYVLKIYGCNYNVDLFEASKHTDLSDRAEVIYGNIQNIIEMHYQVQSKCDDIITIFKEDIEYLPVAVPLRLTIKDLVYKTYSLDKVIDEYAMQAARFVAKQLEEAE